MLIQPNDILLAFKHISLSEELNGTEKQFAGFLVDSYNRKTGRCDPSEETAAFLLRCSQRTIVRAGNRLVQLKLFVRRKHAGHNHCNSYQPNWHLFRESEKRYRERRREYANRWVNPSMSPSECQPSHLKDANLVTQTFPSNNIPSTYPIADADVNANRRESGGKEKQLSAEVKAVADAVHGHSSSAHSPRDVGRIAAERRWNNALLNRFGKDPVYAEILEVLDLPFQEAATTAEMKRRGAGFEYILEEIRRRAIDSSD